MNIKIFYDGVDVGDYSHHQDVVGFTTNLSFMAQGNRNKYVEFSTECLEHANGRPISFQAWADDIDEIEAQARIINSWGENVYVKIPVVTASGSSTVELIRKLHDENIKVNVTVVHTLNQIDSLLDIFSNENQTPTIVSVFAGGISDAGVSPEPIVRYCTDRLTKYSHVETLWAGCQRVLSVIDAERCGCEIVTAPGPIIDKLVRLGKDLDEVAVAKSELFRSDAIESGLEF
jgi:transaldolase